MTPSRTIGTDKLVAVVGSGQMGSGIAQVAAMAGHPVAIIDVSDSALARALDRIGSSLKRLVRKGALAEDDGERVVERIRRSTLLADAAEAAIVIEAVPENEALKVDVFRKLDELCEAGTLFASNTSSIPITRLAAATKRPDRFIGMHFMNPVPVMKLVEVIRGLQTSDETYETVRALAEAWNKRTVLSADAPGFIVNRILMPMINEAIFALQEGLATREDIDAAMKLGTNHPMGPLTLADFIGLDTCLAIMEVLHEGLGDSKYRPCPLLRRYVDAGWLGRKTGRGFYTYPEAK